MAEDYQDDVTAASTSTKSAPSSSSDEDSTAAAAIAVGTGPLLDKDPEAVVKLTNAFWEDLDPWAAEHQARWKANEKRREGVIGVHVVKPDPDRADWKVWAPPGAARIPPTFNQPARLSRRLVSNMFVDEPLPEVIPGGAADSDKPDAAEFQTRILQDVTTAKTFNVPEASESAVDEACTYDSGFVRVYVDPKGSGSKPKTVIASEAAKTVQDALYVDGDGETPQPPPYVTRYVKPDGTLTDDPALAELAWLPGLRSELMNGLNLRPIPSSAESIEECQGIVIRTGANLGDLRKQYAEIDELTNDELWELVQQRPGKIDTILPPAERALPKKKGEDDDPPPDDTKVIVTMVYMGEGATYPAGAYVVVAGTKKLLHRQKWEIKVNGVPETLPIPVAQFKGWREGKRTFYGFHLMHFLGPGQEIRAATIGGAIEHLDRFNRRKTFYTPQTLFQAKMGPAQQGVMVPVQQGSEPKVEQFPDYPKVGMELFDRATAELNDESGLQPIAQGMTDPSIQSGLHAQKVIEQVNIGLGQIKRSTNKGVERLWSIAAVMVRGYFTGPQQIRFRGDDQEYKHKDWTAADLSDAKDVRIMKGTFTMLAPSARLSVAEYMRKLNLIDDHQLRLMASGNIGGLMGLQDDPALLRIRRQISLWQDGPPKAEGPEDPMPDVYPGETSIEEPGNAPANAPNAGAMPMPGPQISPIGGPPAPVPGPVPELVPGMVPPGPEAVPAGPPMGAPMDPAAAMSDPSVIGSIAPAAPAAPPPAPDPMQIAIAQIFKPVPNDEEPAVAQIRFRELSRAMCSKKYERQPEPWRQGFDAEYERMRAAAGVGTAKEAAANQTAAADAAHKKELELRTADTQSKVSVSQAQTAGTMQTKGATDLELQTQKLEHESVIKDAELTSRENEPPPPAPKIAGAGGR